MHADIQLLKEVDNPMIFVVFVIRGLFPSQ